MEESTEERISGFENDQPVNKETNEIEENGKTEQKSVSVSIEDNEAVDEVDGNCTSGINKDEESSDEIGGHNSNGEIIIPTQTEKYALYYSMDHKRRGFAYILNHVAFKNEPLRKGSTIDASELNITLLQLGFEVEPFLNLRKDEIKQHMLAISKRDHSQQDCLLIAVLTHGSENTLHAFDGKYSPDILWENFTADKCPTLAGKPKIFIIQACRGNKFDKGVTLVNVRHDKRTETDGVHIIERYRIPTEADFLIAYSCADGYYSIRNTEEGSWFIQELCQVLQERGFLSDLQTILTLTAQRVAIGYSKKGSPGHGSKQIPCFISKLTRLFLFERKITSPIDQINNNGV